jgi:hypothetical protein
MINRIILIGNGFDLAHEMKTTYKDFINDYWKNVIDKYKKSTEPVFVCETFTIRGYNNSHNPLESFNDLMVYNSLSMAGMNIKNNFLHSITTRMNDVSWGGIEQMYYDELKRSVVNKTNIIQKLNEDFEQVKKLLENYLTSVEDTYKKDKTVIEYIRNCILEQIRFRDLSEDAKDYVVDELISILSNSSDSLTFRQKEFKHDLTLSGKEIDKNHIRKFLLDRSDEVMKDMEFMTTFVTFNYTNTQKLYHQTDSQTIHIHGQLNSDLNPIIFGYGDELDESYAKIEKLNNDYLENIKSINYSKSNNYKRLLETINSSLYQVYIMGHSCDISDRTLLNTIFEHDNCATVKIFFYQRSPNDDDHTHLYKNISRNFNNKRKLRDRVVNKTFSSALVPVSLR